MTNKTWFAGVAADENGFGSYFGIKAETFEDARDLFFNKNKKLMEHPRAFVDMMRPIYQTKVLKSDPDDDIIEINQVDTNFNSNKDLRYYFK